MDHASTPPPTRVAWFPITRILPRDSEDSCHPQPDMNLCEKPGISSNTAVIVLIVLGAVIISSLLAVLTFLHLRRRKIDKSEKLKDLQELDDYGLAPTTTLPSQSTRMPQAPSPAHKGYGPSHSHESEQDISAPDHRPRDRRTSEESLTPSLRQATPAVPRDGLASY